MHRTFVVRVIGVRHPRPFRQVRTPGPQRSGPGGAGAFLGVLVLLIGLAMAGYLVVSRADVISNGAAGRAPTTSSAPPMPGARAPAPGTGTAPDADPLPTPLVLGYYDGGGVGSLGYHSLVREHDVLSGIVPDWYQIWADGAVTGTADPGVVDYAESKGLWIFPLVEQNADPAVFAALFASPTAEKRALANLLALAEQPGYDGVNLDFEGIAPTDRTALTRFVDRLAALLHAHGYYLTLSVPAETANDPANGWSGAYDYRALGEAADLVMIMAYDDHYAGGSPGKVAPAGWVDAVAEFAVRQIAPSKIVLGVPAYGYDWGPAGQPAQALSFGQAQYLDDLYYGGRAGAHFDYVSGGVVHEVYFDDAITFEHQLSVAAALDLRGIVVWRLGLEDPSMWNLLSPTPTGP